MPSSLFQRMCTTDGPLPMGLVIALNHTPCTSLPNGDGYLVVPEFTRVWGADTPPRCACARCAPRPSPGTVAQLYCTALRYAAYADRAAHGDPRAAAILELPPLVVEYLDERDARFRTAWLAELAASYRMVAALLEVGEAPFPYTTGIQAALRSCIVSLLGCAAEGCLATHQPDTRRFGAAQLAELNALVPRWALDVDLERLYGEEHAITCDGAPFLRGPGLFTSVWTLPEQWFDARDTTDAAHRGVRDLHTPVELGRLHAELVPSRLQRNAAVFAGHLRAAQKRRPARPRRKGR